MMDKLTKIEVKHLFWVVGNDKKEEVPKVKSLSKMVTTKKEKMVIVVEDAKWRLDLDVFFWKNRKEKG